MAALAVGMAFFFLGLDRASATAPRPLLGNVLAAAAGLTWALTVMGLRALGREGGSGAAAGAALAGNAITALACLPLALPLAGADGGDWAGVAFLGVVQVGLAYFFLTRALTRVPAFEASLLLLLEPVLNPIWAWLAHGERPGGWSLAGGALILAATAIEDLARRASPIKRDVRISLAQCYVLLTRRAQAGQDARIQRDRGGGADHLCRIRLFEEGSMRAKSLGRPLLLLVTLTLTAGVASAQDPKCGPPGTGQPWGCELDRNFPPTIAAVNGVIDSSLVMRERQNSWVPVWTSTTCANNKFLACASNADCGAGGSCVNAKKCSDTGKTCSATPTAARTPSA